MAKYNYDKKVLSGLGVGPFLNEVKVREEEIRKAPATIPGSVYNANILAGRLHPSVQFGKITEIIAVPGAKTFIIAPDEKKGCREFAYFRAGQYISVALNIGDAKLCKPYSLCSAPESALGETGNTYAITVKETTDGYASKYILENWTEGTELTLSAPLGQFYYTSLRDEKTVIALAGGSGITPFLSMARAIADGTEDFNLTVLYGSRSHDSILLRAELEEAAARSNGKVRIINILSDDTEDGYEHGFITAELIRKYAPEDHYSIFVCGPKAMYRFLETEIAKLSLPGRRVRFELSGEYGDPTADAAYPKDRAGREYKLSVLVRGEKTETVCSSEKSILSACEAAGIRVPSDCRSGECGWCHSRLISGEVYIPETADGRRLADKKFGWIHPCTSYPLSDIEIEVFPMLEG